MTKLRIVEVPIPTYYGDEICHVNGMKYAADVMIAVVKSRAQKYGLLYDPRFDCVPAHEKIAKNAQYADKLGYESTHSMTAAMIPPGAFVADLGCAGGYVANALKDRGCRVVGIDAHPLAPGVELDEFHMRGLSDGLPDLSWQELDYVLLLDVIEHLADPEAFISELRQRLNSNQKVKLVVSTGNVAFLILRLMLLIGKFNYGSKGILDKTHTRLYTFATFRHLFEQNGYEIVETRGVPGPFQLALGKGGLSRALTVLNIALIRVRRAVFAYQIYYVVRPVPSIDYLLAHAQEQSAIRAAA